MVWDLKFPILSYEPLLLQREYNLPLVKTDMVLDKEEHLIW
jgi:hypothetical protein